MICRNCKNTISDTAKFCHKCGCPVAATPPSPSFDPSRNTVTPEPVPEPVPEKKSFNLLKILLPILGLSVLLVVAVIILPIGTMFGSGSADSDGDGGYTGDGTVISSEVGTIVHPSEEHIVTDDETLIQYVDNTVLAFIHSDLTDEEKQDVAATVNGTIIGELYECGSMLQIEVEVSTLSELKELIEVLEEHELVYSAAYDFVMEVFPSATEEDVAAEVDDALSSVEWKNVIQLSDAWEWFGDYFTDEAIYVGVVDNNLLPSYSAISGRVSFGMQYTRDQNDTTDASHGTTVCSIIAGTGGVVYSDNVKCYFDSFSLTYTEYTEALKCLAWSGCKVINNSYGVYYPSEEDYLNNEELTAQYASYSDYMEIWKESVEAAVEDIAKLSCSIIGNCDDILFVQGAGNGIANFAEVGVDAVYNGFWAGITDSDSIESICNKYSMTYQDLKDHILVVTAANKDLSYTGFNYGSTVDIAGPHSSTSFASAVVTGVATLVWAADSELTTAEVKQILTHSNADLGTSDLYAGEVPVVNAFQAVYEALYTHYSVAIVDEAGSPVSGITLQVWDAEGEILAEETTEDDGVATLVANRMEIDCVVVLDSDGEVLETIVVPEEAKTYDYYSTDMCYAYDIEKYMPHDLGTVVVEIDYLALYAEIVRDYEDKYGVGVYYWKYDYVGDHGYEVNGTYLVQLLDFDGDGTDELMVCAKDGQYYFVNVWAYSNGSVSLVYSFDLLGSDNYFYSAGDSIRNILETGDGTCIAYTSYNGSIYLIQGFSDGSSEYYFYGYIDGEFKLVKTTYNDDQGNCTVDDKSVTTAEWNATINLLMADETCYTIRWCTEQEAQNILEITAATKKALGLMSDDWYKTTTFTSEDGTVMTFAWQDNGTFLIEFDGKAYSTSYDFDASEYFIAYEGTYDYTENVLAYRIVYQYDGDGYGITYDADANAVCFVPGLGGSTWFYSD